MPTPDKIEKYTQLLSHYDEAQQPQDMTANKTLDRKRLVGSGMIAARLLSYITGEEVFLQHLTYLLRTGSPDGQDLLGAMNFAMIAARLASENKYGRMAAFVKNEMWTDVDIQVAMQGVKTVDVETWYDVENYKPKLSLIWSVEE